MYFRIYSMDHVPAVWREFGKNLGDFRGVCGYLVNAASISIIRTE